MKKTSTKRLKEYPKADVPESEYRRLSRVPKIEWDDTPLDWEYRKSAKEFIKNNVVCFPVLDSEELTFTRERVTLAILDAPEFKEKNSLIRQFDKFGALGIASSFHHPELRALRRIIANRSSAFKRIVKKAYEFEYYHELLDRLSFRRVGTSEFKQTAHTDNTPLGTEESDSLVAGSITNLNDHDIFFSCIPGSAKAGGEDAGFHRLNSKSLEFTEIRIPPGYRCIFNQNIIHEVNAKVVYSTDKRYYGQFRLYQGISWQNSPEPVFGKEYLDRVIEYQYSPLLPSGQRPLLYAKFLGTHFPIDIQLFANTFIGSMRSNRNILYPVMSMCPFSDMEKYYEQQQKLGNTVKYMRAFAVKSKIPSLKSLGIDYEPWSEDEKTPFYCESI